MLQSCFQWILAVNGFRTRSTVCKPDTLEELEKFRRAPKYSKKAKTHSIFNLSA